MLARWAAVFLNSLHSVASHLASSTNSFQEETIKPAEACPFHNRTLLLKPHPPRQPLIDEITYTSPIPPKGAGAGLVVEAGAGARAPPCFVVKPEKCRGMCSVVKDQSIFDEITWIARLVKIKIKSQT